MVVLHVTRANLINIHVLAHHFDLRRVHHFADREQAEFIGGFAHQFQARFTHALKCVGRSARFEGARAQNLSASFGDGFGNSHHLFARFNRTWSCCDHHIRAADFDAAAQVNHRPFRFELPAREFEGLRDAHNFAHAFQQLKIAMIKSRCTPTAPSTVCEAPVERCTSKPCAISLSITF
jgi:hypothetical protein